MNGEELLKLAEKARENAYSPYSNYMVGAALLCKNGKVYMGCNVENSSYGATVCAERNAIFAAVCHGDKDFEAIAIVGGYKDGSISSPCYPCGMCRQVMSEFCKKDFNVYLKNGEDMISITLDRLLPSAFELN